MTVRARITILLALLLLAFAGAVWHARNRVASPAHQATARTETSLEQLRTNRWNYDEQQAAATALARLGDDAIPTLAAALKGQDSDFHKAYDRWRAKLPPEIQSQLPNRASRDDLRRAVAGSLYDMGPTACRALLGSLEFALETGRGFENTQLIRALYWSIPESPKAIQILSNYLAHPHPENPLFGMRDAEEIWPNVPHFAPLLALWLPHADNAREAAEGLSHMGTNAHFAIPQIVELAYKGYVGPLSNSTLHVSYVPNLETNILHYNKSAALKALGTLRVATPEVLEVIAKNLTNEFAFLRACAANTLGDLGPEAAPILPALLSNLDQTHETVLRYQLEAIGKFGPAAKAAIPTLLRFADETTVTNIPSGEPFSLGIRWGWDPLHHPFVAAVAVAKIDLAAAKPLAAQIAGAFNGLITTNEIMALRPLRHDLLPHLERAAEKGGTPLLTYHTLVLDPTHQSAKKSLLKMMQTENPINLRSVAALWHFNIFRDTNLTLEVFHQTLPEVRDLQTQTPVTVAGQLGPAARPLVPYLKPILTNDHRIMRNLAGKALRAIAPDEMPRIDEN